MNGYNFTERVRKVLAMAREEAARLHHEYVGTEHILLGLIREGEGVAATVLQNLSVELEDIQQNLYDRALAFRESRITVVDDFDTFQKVLDEKGGFISAHWDGTAETEEKIKEMTKATIRCIPLDNPQEEGKDILTGKPSKERVLFARAY